jgi:hypothetical protein
MTHGREKSDPSIVAVRLANKTGQSHVDFLFWKSRSPAEILLEAVTTSLSKP